MKKTIIALAFALPMAAPAFADTANVDIYGTFNVSAEHSTAEGAAGAVESRGSHIGFRGTEDLGGDLTAVWQIERGFDATSGTEEARDTFVGLSSRKFGSVKAGMLSMPYRGATEAMDPFKDTLADLNSVAGQFDILSSSFDARAKQAVSYTAPEFHGLTFSAGMLTTNSVSMNDAANSVDGYSMAANYTRGSIYATVAYQHFSDVFGVETGHKGSNALKVGGGYSFGKVRLGLINEDVRGAVGDRNSWVANAVYDMGPLDLKAQYGRVAEAADHANGFTVGADYTLSKRTVVYALATRADEEDAKSVKALGLGLRHNF